jgi:hypothetical protein
VEYFVEPDGTIDKGGERTFAALFLCTSRGELGSFQTNLPEDRVEARLSAETREPRIEL